MSSRTARWLPGVLLVALCLPVRPALAAPQPLAFHLTFDRAVSDQPFTGRVYVLLSKPAMTTLPAGPNWFKPEPFFALDVKGWKPGEKLVLGSSALGCPVALAKLPSETYSIMAVMDFDRGARTFSAAEGNGHSKAVRRPLDPARSGPVELKIDQVYHEKPFVETERVKLVSRESKLLSAFHGQPVYLRAGVVLPASYAKEPGKRYPVIYEVPGFSGTHFGAFAAEKRNCTDVAGVEMLYVVLNPDCRLGHHVFADSANNGPCGRALIEELIPHIEKRFRALGTPAARFVTGHSSGGWSSLWLQVTYPDFFGGVWSTAPDPVDFRDFQRIDVTRAGANVFFDERGKLRPIARNKGKVVLEYRPFSDMEVVMGHGGQLASFEAVFSPRGPDCLPLKLWDRTTGAVDPRVARSWERYDIRLVLERGWKTLGPRLAGKLHVYMGGEDNFYLEGAVVLLKEALKRLGSDAVVEIFPGRDHRTLMDKEMRARIAREMAEQFRRRQARAD